MATQGNRDIAPLTLNFGSGWKEPRYRLKRTACGPRAGLGVLENERYLSGVYWLGTRQMAPAVRW